MAVFSQDNAQEPASSSSEQNVEGIVASDTIGAQNTPDAPTGVDAYSGIRTSDLDYSDAMSYHDGATVEGTRVLSTIESIDSDSRRERSTVRGSRLGIGDYDISRTNVPSSIEAPTVIWGTEVSIAHVLQKFEHFLTTFLVPADTLENEPPLQSVVADSADVFGAHGRTAIDPTKPLYIQRLADVAALQQEWLDIDCAHLKLFSPSLTSQMLTYPKEVIPAMDSAVENLYCKLFSANPLPGPLRIRPFNCSVEERGLRSLSPDELDQLVSVSGLVTRVSELIPELMQAVFKCSMCNYVLGGVMCERGRLQEPHACSRCHALHTLQLIHNRCVFANKQIVKLQETPDDMPAGETPRTITAFCYESLVDTVSPGDRVIITGIYRAHPIRNNPRQRALKSVYKIYIDVLHFKKKSQNKLRMSEESDVAFTAKRVGEIFELSTKADLYERLSSAIASSIFEHEDIKKGILLQLFGGTRKDFSEAGGSSSFRADVNVLLCGDPGTSKSQLLSYVYRLLPRSQYTSGKGSSAAGLTAYVTRDPENRQLSLQTGALVLADNGVCCIDEFDKMPDTTRSILHEVMESQTLSIAKAGIICQLNARTSILAAANPVGSKWNMKQTILENIKLPHTLLSRFDLIFLMLDPQNELYDSRLARHLIGLYQQKSETDQLWNEKGMDMSLLRDYIAYAKAHINPKLTDAVCQYLVEEYVNMRQVGARMGGISAYPRQLESLIRLSEAHARMRLSETVTLDDCREARRLQREALKQAATDPTTGCIDVNILTTGVSGHAKRRMEEIGNAVWSILESRRILTFSTIKILQELRSNSDRQVTREAFEDALNWLKAQGKIDWATNTIRKMKCMT